MIEKNKENKNSTIGSSLLPNAPKIIIEYLPSVYFDSPYSLPTTCT